MVELNLLPWRAQKKEFEAKRLRLQVFLSVLAAVFLVVMLDYYIRLDIRQLTVNSQVPDVVEQTEDVLFSQAELLKFIVNANGICLHSLEYRDSKVSMTGNAYSIAALLAYFRLHPDIFSRTTFTHVAAVTDSDAKMFELTVNLS